MKGNASGERTATKAQLEAAYTQAVDELRSSLVAMRDAEAGSEEEARARQWALEASITARKAQVAILHFEWSPVGLEFLRVEERRVEEADVFEHRPHLGPVRPSGPNYRLSDLPVVQSDDTRLTDAL